VNRVSPVALDDAWLLGQTLARDQNGFQHGLILHYTHGTWQTMRIPPRPPAGEWTVRLGYAWMAYLLLLFMPLALGFLMYSRGQTASALAKWGYACDAHLGNRILSLYFWRDLDWPLSARSARCDPQRSHTWLLYRSHGFPSRSDVLCGILHAQ
jgi:hypothetical protein